MHPYENLDAHQKRHRAWIIRTALFWMLFAGVAVILGTLAIHNARADVSTSVAAKVYIVAARIIVPGQDVPMYSKYNHEPFAGPDAKKECEDFIQKDPHLFQSLPQLRAIVESRLPGSKLDIVCFEADAPDSDGMKVD